MKKKALILTVVYLCLTLTDIRAQSKFLVGVSGGYNRNFLTTDDGYRTFTSHHPMNGFQIGFPVQYYLTDWFAIQLEPSYIQKNYQLRRSAFFEGIEQQSKNDYLQIPIMAHFFFGGKQLRGFLNIGGYGAYWMHSRISGTAANVFAKAPELEDGQQLYHLLQLYAPYRYDEKFVFDKRRDRRWEFGLLAGIGLEYVILDDYKIFVEGRYYYSVSDQQRHYMVNQIPRYNNTVGVQIGVLFDLGNHLHKTAR